MNLFFRFWMFFFGAMGLVSASLAQQLPVDSEGRAFDPTGRVLENQLIVPLNFDLAGTWKLDPLREQPGSVWNFPNSAASRNYAHYGNDRFTLVRGKTEILPGSDITTLRVHYSGAYFHKHATGKATPQAVAENGSWLGAIYEFNCREEDFVFPIAGHLSLYSRAGTVLDVGLRLDPPGGKGFPREFHGSFYAPDNENNARNYWSLFQDLSGNSLAADFVVAAHELPEPAPTDPCNFLLRDYPVLFQSVMQQSIEGRITNNQYLAFYRRVSAPGPLDARGSIRGHLRDRLNQLSITNAEVRLFKQFKYVRPQRVNETSQEYARYAEPMLTRSETVSIDRNGNFEFSVPLLFDRENEDGSTSLTLALYALQVANAEANAGFLADTNNPTIHYQPVFLTNLQPKESAADPMVISLEAETVFAAKADLVRSLMDASANNYAPIEAGVLDYLNRVKSGALVFTMDREEGLNRAVWAERAVHEGVSRADQFIGTMLDGAGTLLADLYELAFEFVSGDVKEGREALDKLKASSGKPLPPFLKIPDALNRTDALNKMLQVGQSFEVFDGIEKALKGLTAAIQAALIAKGMDTPQAIYLSDTIHLIFKTVVAGLKSNHALGATAEFQKIMIQEITKQLAPLLLDNSLEINIHLPWKAAWETDQDFKKVLATFPSLPSYCKWTTNSLALSAAQMQSWSTHDRTRYFADISKAAFTIEGINRTATVLADVFEHTKAIAKSGDGIADAVGAIATLSGGNPFAKGVELAAKVAKWGGNTATFVGPAVFVFHTLPGKVEEAVRQAYGIEPPPGPPPAPSIMTIASLQAPAATAPPAALPVNVATARSQVFTALRRMSSALKTNDLGTAIAVASDGTNGALATLATFHRVVRQATTQAAGLQPTNNAMSQAAFSLMNRETAFGIHAAGFSQQLVRFYASAMAGEFPTASDSAYLQARNEVLASTQSLLLLVDTLNAAVSGWQLDNRNRPHIPAAMVELSQPVSETSGGTVISASSETFVVRAHVSNLSSLALSNLTARLRILAAPGTVTIMGPAEIPVATGLLQPLDSRGFSGADEADLQWKISFDGALDSKTVHLTADLLESGGTPVSFVSAPASRFLQVSPSLADSDSDGLPDDFELRRGLNPRLADGSLDPDGDGLSNLEEFKKHTDPLLADSDSDGASDGREVLRDRTDPLDPDTDGDGAPDGQDAQPLNALSAATALPAPEPAVGLDFSTVLLDTNTPSVTLIVTNRGQGSLFWMAKSGNAALAEVHPGFPAISASGDALTVALPVNYNPTNSGVAITRVRIFDIGGADPDYQDVTIIVGGSFPGPKVRTQFSQVQRTADGAIILTLVGEPGARESLEAAATLGSWSPLGVVTNLTGTIQFVDRPPAETPARYYRSAQQP